MLSGNSNRDDFNITSITSIDYAIQIKLEANNHPWCIGDLVPISMLMLNEANFKNYFSIDAAVVASKGVFDSEKVEVIDLWVFSCWWWFCWYFLICGVRFAVGSGIGGDNFATSACGRSEVVRVWFLMLLGVVLAPKWGWQWKFKCDQVDLHCFHLWLDLSSLLVTYNHKLDWFGHWQSHWRQI